MKKTAVLLALLYALTAGTFTFMAARFARQSEASAGTMASRTDGAKTVTEADLLGLPAPVSGFFSFSGVTGRKFIASAKVTHTGSCRQKENGGWTAAQGTYYMSAVKPAYIRSDKCVLFPGICGCVRESYADGTGSRTVMAVPFFKTREETGPEISQAFFMDYFTCRVLMPTSLLPSPNVRWQNAGERSATLLFNDLGSEGALIVKFNHDGSMESMTGLRYRTGTKSPVLDRWTCKPANYIEVDGFKVPGYLEYSWNTTDAAQGNRDEPYLKVMVKGVYYGY